LDIVECEIPAFLIAEFGHPLEEIRIMWGLSRLHTDKADTQHLWLLLRALAVTGHVAAPPSSVMNSRRFN
jgi:hypothetical protein